MFLCRENELLKLNRRYKNNGLECIIIYGRRRVGKTALINEFIKDKPTIYFPALAANAQGNLAALSKAIHTFHYPDAVSAPVYSSFDEAFSEITRILKENGRVVFVIDEYPYLAKSDESIASRLQHLLDHDWADTNLFLILCGSSVSFMEDEVLSSKSPLFGRRTGQFRIEPLTYLESARFHPELSPEENALIYGITGGIPHYIRKLNVQTTVKDALLENLLDPSSYLFEEPENLLRQELREPAIYNSIITAVANGASKQSEIASKAGIEITVSSKYLRVLTELGIITKIEPVIDKTKRKTQYRITDNFFRFWYRFVPENMMQITSGTILRTYDTVVGKYLPEYMGLVFEQICRQYLLYYMKEPPFPFRAIGEWWGTDPVQKKEAQLDIVAIGDKDENLSSGQNFLIGSCKYKNELIGTDELRLIQDYSAIFTSAKDDCFYYIFSKSGFTNGLNARAKEVRLFTLEDLYN